MSRNLGPSCKQCKREGVKLMLKGARCLDAKKCALDKNRGGFAGSARRRKPSDYCIQLREKQKVKRLYGLLEGQFRKYYKEADRVKGVTGDNLLKILESRLDTVVYRMNFSSSRKQARQLIAHGHVRVNGVKTRAASFIVRPGDQIEISDKSKNLLLVKDSLKTQKSGPAHWVEVDMDKLNGKLVTLPEVQDMEIPMNLQLIVELYSK